MTSDPPELTDVTDPALRALIEFRELWRTVISLGEAAIHGIAAGDEEAWTEARRVSNRALGSVTDALKDREFTFGMTFDAFQMALAEIPRLESLASGSYINHLMRASTIGTASIDQAIGRRAAELERDATRGPDELLALATDLGITKFGEDLALAERRMQGGDNREAVVSARSALEIAVKEIANRLTPAPKSRTFGDAVTVLQERGLLHPGTAAALRARDVSVYGWLSTFGTHRDDVDETLRPEEFEARLAIDLVRAWVGYLLGRLREATYHGS